MNAKKAARVPKFETIRTVDDVDLRSMGKLCERLLEAMFRNPTPRADHVGPEQ
jgi:hypothetical protein